MSRVLSAWAWHFCQHYITDANLPVMVGGTPLQGRISISQPLFVIYINNFTHQYKCGIMVFWESWARHVTHPHPLS